MIKEITNEEFNDEIKSGLVLVDFYAVWCGPCKMMHPVIEEIGSKYTDIKVLKVNVDNREDLAHKYGVMSIPTIILFKDGKLKEKNVGFISLDELSGLIDRNK